MTDMTISPGAGVLGGEKRFIGSLGGSGVPERDFPRFLAWHREGKLDLDSLVTARYALDEINEATQALKAGRSAVARSWHSEAGSPGGQEGQQS